MGATVVAGIDVGGPAKGFHAVALHGRRLAGTFASTDPRAIAAWCVAQRAVAIGVDAPSRWSTTGRARSAERALAQEGIHCFASPTREKAAAHTGTFYAWMFNGEALFAALRGTHAVVAGEAARKGPVCFETFPQAVACVLAGRIVPARQKGTIRRRLLAEAGVDCAQLTRIDLVDAALCALAATAYLAGKARLVGDREEGFIVLPGVSAR